MPSADAISPHDVAALQTSFISFIVEPLYEAFSELVPDVHDECIVNLHANKEHYAAILRVSPGFTVLCM